MADEDFLDTLFKHDVGKDGNGLTPIRLDDFEEAGEEAKASLNESGYVVVDQRAFRPGPDHNVIQAFKLCTAARPGGRNASDSFKHAEAMLRKSNHNWHGPEDEAQVKAMDEAVGNALAWYRGTRVFKMVATEVYGDDSRQSMDKLEEDIRELWFKRKGGRGGRTGFEHVLVGERGRYGSSIGGYHFWYKYARDDAVRVGDSTRELLHREEDEDSKEFEAFHELRRARNKDQLEFLGFGDHAARVTPDVVTLAFRITDAAGKRWRKSLGGFFVGSSMEFLLASAVYIYRNMTRDSSRALTTINGHRYSLVLVVRGGTITTYYPIYDEPAAAAGPWEVVPDSGAVTPEPITDGTPRPTEHGQILFVSALLNPEGRDEGNEQVVVCNTTGGILTLQGCSVRTTSDGGGVPRVAVITKASLLKPLHFGTFMLPGGRDATLFNKGGKMELLAPGSEERVIHIVTWTEQDVLNSKKRHGPVEHVFNPDFEWSGRARVQPRL